MCDDEVITFGNVKNVLYLCFMNGKQHINYENSTKQCNTCKEFVSFEKFTKTRGKFNANCKKCTSEKERKRRANFSEERKEKEKQKDRNRRHRRIDGNFPISWKYNLKKYGLSPEEYDKIFITQNGKCAICNKEETIITKYGYKARMHVDHNHSTGKIRELLCSACNHAIGLFKENVEVMKSAIEYLIKHNNNGII